MSERTVRALWESFMHAAYPKQKISAIQRRECRRAFYGACAATLSMMREIADEAATEDEGAAALEMIDNELRQFVADMLRGKA